jgi:dipeptidyl aminopeptidase/acylaminoacyl peptidase
MKNLIFTFLLFILINSLKAQSFTLENLMAAPMASNLTVSPISDKIVWVDMVKGVRNIYMATPPQYLPIKLTNFDKDDGIEISNLEWNLDEKTLFFIKGNVPQVQSNQSHNPSHVLEGTVPTIFQLEMDSKKTVKIGTGANPSISPDGQKLLFTRGRQIYIKNTNDTMAATQLCQVRNGASQVRWSPDGQKLAFVSSRGTHSFVGIYDFEKKDYSFLDTSVDNDTEPIFSPDSKQVAFLRLRRDFETNVSFFPIREQEPWSIVVADVTRTNSPCHVIFTADKGMGSVYWNHTGKQQLLWTSTNHLVFAWEKTGWQQLYSIPATGGKPVQLTKGDFEVDEVALSRDKRQVLFNSNQNDMDRKHVWVADLPSPSALQLRNEAAEKGFAKILTNSKKIEWNIQQAANGSALFLLQSDERTPSHVVMYDVAKGVFKNISETQNANIQAQLVEPQAITLTAKDGIKFQNQVFLPKNVKNDKSHPAVIFVHGGSRRQMLLGYHAGAYYGNAYHMSQYFAAKGYVALAINYRSGIGYGRDFREAENYGASGNSEFQDLEAAGEWLKQHPSVSGAKIVVWGGSYGGFMTAHALSRRSDLFAAGTDIHGVHNWNTEIPTFMPDYDSLRFPKHAQIAYKSSPIYYLDGWKSPVLFAHGDDDQNVPFSETENIMRLLRKKNVETELLVVPDEVHGFLRHESWYKIYVAMADFFERKLKK